MPCRQAHISCFSITLMMIVREQALGAPETLTQEIALAALPCSTASGPQPIHPLLATHSSGERQNASPFSQT
jgi:hypothetical protein